MSADHLPECPCFLSVRENVCLCDRLRKCEDRVRGHAMVNYEHGCRDGYAAALDQLVELLSGLPMHFFPSDGFPTRTFLVANDVMKLTDWMREQRS